MSRFALLANLPTPEQQTLLTTMIAAQGAGWWHWFATSWLIDDQQERELGVWSVLIRQTTPTLTFLLIDLDNPNRAPIGYMRPEWYEWIGQRWPM